ncbi:hypothetical protein CHS0354_032475 [Potamilus streckersoni]|uniref:Mediator of RNA polymerase II transcription subunit 29 n=1 Tax=Potamilus streckersoni TaxID=2493646 RepID=A0AAE0SQH3_9BIVA|nr:hypothetical protein CHS0354_032475 [Potamilus streckersoni]
MAAPSGTQQTQPVANPSQAAQSQAQDVDPITKFKQFLLPRLKESLVNLMKIAGQCLYQNAQAVDSSKPADGLQQKFERNLEEFYSICDQIEVNLRLALETNIQMLDSMKYTPVSAAIPKSDGGQVQEGQTVPYPQFLTTLKQQIACAKELHELFSETAKKLLER